MAVNVLILALGEGGWSASHSDCCTPGEITVCASWMGGWLEPTTAFNHVDKAKVFEDPSSNRTPTARLQIMSYLECD